MWDSDFTSDKTFGSEPKGRSDHRMMCRRSHDWTRREESCLEVKSGNPGLLLEER